MSTTIFNNRTLTARYEYDATASRFNGNWTIPSFQVAQTNGSLTPGQGASITLYSFISSVDLGATISTAGLTGYYSTSFPVTGAVNTTTTKVIPGSTSEITSSPTGAYLYAWLSHDQLTNPCTLTVYASPSIVTGVDTGANLRYTPGVGLQWYNPDTGLWYTKGVTNDPPQDTWSTGVS